MRAPLWPLAVARRSPGLSMGVVLTRTEVVKGLEPLSAFSVDGVRNLFDQFEEICPTPALWERAFYELMNAFQTPEACNKAFCVLDTDQNGFIDARETIGGLAVLSKGHLSDRMTLLFDIFDLNKERAVAFDECFMMLRRTGAGLRKMLGILTPPEKVIHNMTKQVWKSAKKHRDTRLLVEEWHAWWSCDSSIRSFLKMVTWKPEELRGLPTPDQLVSIDYTRGIAEDNDAGGIGNAPGGARQLSPGARPTSSSKVRRPSGRADEEPAPGGTAGFGGAVSLTVPGGGVASRTASPAPFA